jgi:DNA mismatch endonuclease, patch repair protein
VTSRKLDDVSPERSRLMARVRQKHTTAELRVRSVLHRLGYRFRLHPRNLPGRPDIVLPKHRTAIFVHGCFWHQHSGCSKASMPKTRQEFWAAKFRANIERDERKERALRDLGWHVVTLWECETRSADNLKERLRGGLV